MEGHVEDFEELIQSAGSEFLDERWWDVVRPLRAFGFHLLDSFGEFLQCVRLYRFRGSGAKALLQMSVHSAVFFGEFN